MQQDWAVTGVATAEIAGSSRARLSELVASGMLCRRYPGVYIDAGRIGEPVVEATAAQAYCPRGIIVGQLALSLWCGWPWRTGLVEMVGCPDDRPVGPLRRTRAELSSDWWEERRGLRLASPALCAAYCAATDDGRAIDEFLRTGGSLADVEQASTAMKGWAGHTTRRRVVRDSRDEPWSAAERLLHRVLREARIGGWKANLRVVAGGWAYFLDAGFAGARLYLEADGYQFHASQAAFESDRIRHNALTLAGWQGLHFTWSMLQDGAAVAATVRLALNAVDASALAGVA